MTDTGSEPARLFVLGIETSCDETAAAVVSGAGEVLGETLLSQLDEHRPYGGVVPEIAARSHLTHLDRLVAQAMAEAGVGFGDLSAVAATGGPGLIGGVMVGAMTAKAIAAVHGLPFIAVNHLEGHALSARLTEDIEFPFLLLLISGGHCELLSVAGVGQYTRLGATLDDAAGEAFDKAARLLGLGYPGGPAIEAAARDGTPGRFTLPRPMKGRAEPDFSFAGLKTAVRHAVDALPEGERQPHDVADLAAEFQAAVGDVLADRCARALALFRESHPEGRAFVVAGGVAANQALRARLTAVAADTGFSFHAPPLEYCTDNAAMIAWAGVERLRLGSEDSLDFRPRPRWPLDAAAIRS